MHFLAQISRMVKLCCMQGVILWLQSALYLLELLALSAKYLVSKSSKGKMTSYTLLAEKYARETTHSKSEAHIEILQRMPIIDRGFDRGGATFPKGWLTLRVLEFAPRSSPRSFPRCSFTTCISRIPFRLEAGSWVCRWSRP